MNQKPTISILGCGWYGMALAKNLVIDGYAVKGSTTTESKLQVLAAHGIEPFLVDFELENKQFDPAFFQHELLIISIPPKRSSPTLINFPEKIKHIIAAANNGAVKQVIFISSTGVFADGNLAIDENSIPQPVSESGKVMLTAENILRENTSFGTTIIRFAGLIGPDRNLARHFAGKKQIANGLAPINLIHLADCIGLTKSIINQAAFGEIYHGVMPDHPTREDFYSEVCRLSGFEKPEFMKELLTWKKINSINVPKFLNYQYVFGDSSQLSQSLTE